METDEIELHLSPFLHSLCSFFYVKMDQTYLKISAARPPMQLHPALDGPATANRLWMERLGGPNAKPAWSSVIDEPLE